MEPWFEYVVNSIVAVGALATAGSFIYMLLHQKEQDKRISDLENLQIDSMYRPNIRIKSYGNDYVDSPLLTIENAGEDIVIESISSVNGISVNTEGMATWFPYNFDKSNILNIPLKSFIDSGLNGTIVITANDKLLRHFAINIVCKNGKFIVSTPEPL